MRLMHMQILHLQVLHADKLANRAAQIGGAVKFSFWRSPDKPALSKPLLVVD
jgi:hypothetical protein